MLLFAARPPGYPRRTHLGTALRAGDRLALASCGIAIGRDWEVRQVSARRAGEEVSCRRCIPRLPAGTV